MSDLELIQDILSNIMTAIERIDRRFQGIESPEDFVIDNDGVDRLEGIATSSAINISWWTPR